MAPKTAVSAVADKVARHQVKQNEMDALNRVNNCNNEQNSFELDDQLSGRTNSTARKRVNSCESTSAKRKYQVSGKSKDTPLKQHSDRLANCSTPTSVPSTIIIPNSSSSGSCSKTENSVQTTADKPGQPKLLIMSGSVNKQTNVNSNPADHQLINVDMSSKHQLQSLPQPITLTTSSTSGHKSSPTEGHQLISTSQPAKVHNPKVQGTPPKLVFLPSNPQTKTLTIPISNKTLPNSTFLYAQQPIVTGTTGGLVNCSTSSTLKSMPGITIQAIKTTQGGNKPNSNYIFMPNKAASSGQQISQTALSGAKGLLRPMNAKEFPLMKFISTTTAPDGLIKKDPNDRTDANERFQQPQQPTIILTNVSKETANSLASSPIRNLVHPNIIKVVPKSASMNALQANKANRQTSPNRKGQFPTIAIPASNAFMEILKNIPINRISPQLSNSDGKTTQISITPNPSGSNMPSITKTFKIAANSTESFSKLFNNVMTSNSLTSAGGSDSTRKEPKSGGSVVTDVKGSLENSEAAKKNKSEVEAVNKSADDQSEAVANSMAREAGDEGTNCDLVKATVARGVLITTCDDTASKEATCVTESANNEPCEKRSVEEDRTATEVPSEDKVVE